MGVNSVAILKIVSLFAILNFIFLSGILLKNGIILNRDFTFPLYRENFIRYHFPLWNDITSQPNFEMIIRAPFRIALTTLSADISLILKMLIYFAYFLSSVGMYLYLKILVKNEYFSILGSLFFTLSLPLLQFMGEIAIVYGISSLPLLLWLSHKFKEEKSFKWAIFSSLCLLIFSAQHPFTLVVNLIIFIMYNLFLHYRTYNFSIISITLFLLLFLWFSLPYFQVNLSPQKLGREELKRGMFDFISENLIFKILTLARDRFLYIQQSPSQNILIVFWYFLLLVSLIIAFLPLIFYKNLSEIKVILFFYIVYIIATMFSLGSKIVTGDLYYFFVSSNNIGWIFRSPLKFQLYQAFAFSILFTFGVSALGKIFKKELLSFLVGIIILFGISVYSLIYANTKDMTPVTIPTEFYKINEILSNISDDSKVIWYPRYNEKPTVWLDRPVQPFDIISSRKDTYSTWKNYNYIERYLYEDVYPNKLKDLEFYDFLRAVGIKYIVFHNDRNNTIDSKALENILKTLGNEHLIYASKDWFLFNLSYANPRICISSNIILSNDTKFSKFGVVLLIDNNLKNSDISSITYIDEKNLTNYFFEEDNLISNPSFELQLINWTIPKSYKYNISIDKTCAIDGNASLRVSTNSTNKGWIFIKSNEIDVKNDEIYVIQAYMKYLNMIEGFYSNENKWKDIFYLTMREYNASSEWQNYVDYIRIQSNVTKVRIIPAVGWAASSYSEGIIWFDNIKLFPLSKLFPDKCTSSFYRKISPTNWNIYVNMSRPSILVFTESYDPLWEARVYKDGKLVEKVKPIPLYGIINGFWISTTGDNLEIVIRYTPQDWFEIGLVISGITFASCLFYLFYDWRRSKRDKWAIKLESKLKNIKFVRFLSFISYS